MKTALYIPCLLLVLCAFSYPPKFVSCLAIIKRKNVAKQLQDDVYTKIRLVRGCREQADPIKCIRDRLKQHASSRAAESIDQDCTRGSTRPECGRVAPEFPTESLEGLTGTSRLKRVSNNWEMCPGTIGRLRCFENYLAVWMSVVMENQGKRTTFGPGKRSGGGKQNVCPPGVDQVVCFERHVGMYLNLLQSPGKGAHYGGNDARGNINLVRSRIVGKRSNTDEFCSKGETKRDCRLRYLRQMLNFHPRFRNIVCHGYEETQCTEYLLGILQDRMFV